MLRLQQTPENRSGRPGLPARWPVVLVALVGASLSAAGLAQTPAAEGAWFGVPLPPVFEPHVAPAIIGDRGPSPATVPPDEGEYS